ncbi:MAG TPA: ABC transporter substrate-binding protein [Mycobacteriales bacterium]|nr:ABC transporter substrate-binding protein [Mycobacteriales bacterium]
MSALRPPRLHRRRAAALALTALVITGCGLQPDARQTLDAAVGGEVVGDEASSLAGGDAAATGDAAAPDVPGAVEAAPGDVTTFLGGGGGPGAGPRSASGGGGAPGTAPGGAPGRAPGSSGASGPAQPTSKGSTVGITDSEIRIGIHAPLSGASPLPQESFETGKELYWKGKTVFGRKIVTEVLDDTYKPSGAVRVCQEMARRDFIVLGGAGTDQIQACARDRSLQRTKTPYLSAGVTENGLAAIPTYFALSLTYPQQAPLVIENARRQDFLLKKNASGESKWAVVISDTPNFKDAQSSMEAALTAAELPYKTFLTSKSPSNADATSLANELRAYNAPVVYFLGQPTFFINVVANTSNSLYTPVWTGVGPSMALNAVANVACPSSGNRYDGRFLHPYQGFDKAPPEFLKAGGIDDIQLSLWLSAEILHQQLLSTKGVLTREAFMAGLEGSTYSSNGLPFVKITKTDHFGGLAAFSLKSDCSKRQYVTLFDGKPLYAK